MSTFLGWLLLLGGIATTVAATLLATEVEFEVALALGGLLATLFGAVVLLLARVAGDAPPDLRPPGASSRPRSPSPGSAAGPPGPRRRRRPGGGRTSKASGSSPAASGRAPSMTVVGGPGTAASTVAGPDTWAPLPALLLPTAPNASAPSSPARQAIPGTRVARPASRLPVLTAAFVAGMAWSLTGTGGRDGPLDLLAGVLFLATPLAVFVAIATRLTRGRAWSPAVTLVMAAASLLLGSLTAATLIDLLG